MAIAIRKHGDKIVAISTNMPNSTEDIMYFDDDISQALYNKFCVDIIHEGFIQDNHIWILIDESEYNLIKQLNRDYYD